MRSASHTSPIRSRWHRSQPTSASGFEDSLRFPLHDTVEDTDYSLDLLRRDFGTIAMLVDGVTKPTSSGDGD
jgi:hypothetical protein